ncbi:MAG TPA: hypothetical protein VIA18_11220 [Polyangia bacterium]|nr:hypothetical protein [Polyangia bacterium]
METRPSDEALAAAVGAPGKKVKQVGGGPYLYQFVIDGVGYQVIAIDGKVSFKSLPALGRYLQATQLLEKKQLKTKDLMVLLRTYAELPSGIDDVSDQRSCPFGPPPGLTYGADDATLVLYDTEKRAESAPPPPGNLPRLPMPSGAASGVSAPVWLQAKLHIGHDYAPQWQVERYDASQHRWLPR